MSKKKNEDMLANSIDAEEKKMLSEEAIILLDNHRKRFHEIEKKDCKICRSFRRTILGGLSI